MNTLKFGNSEWYGTEGNILAYNDENENFKPLPFDFSRGSSATRVNQQGLIETVGANDARVDYLNNANGALKLEPSRTNLITQSNNFLDSSWNVFRGSVTANATISPDGTLNASRYQEDSQTGSHLFRRQNLSITNGLSYTGSIFVKKGELTSIILQSNSNSRWVASATFDLENGTVTSGTGVIEDYGNGWYRCSISGNAVQTTTAAGLEMYTSIGVGRDGDGLFMYGAMFEQGSYPTSIIKTEGTAQTRLADSCSQTPPDGVIGQTEGVIFLDFKKEHNGIETWSINDGTSSNRVYMGFSGSDFIGQVRSSGGSSQAFFSTPINNDTRYKCAIAYKQNDFVLYINGVQRGTDNSGVVPLNMSKLSPYASTSSDGAFFSPTNEVKLYNTRLSNSELAALTTI